MENLLIEFINTFDISLKKFRIGSGFTKLTISQIQYIDAIHSLGEPTITEIAGRLNITKASVTAGIHKLAVAGYVVKTESNQDKRVFHVRLTDAAMEFIQAKYQALKEYDAVISAALNEQEARQFEAALTKIIKRFKQA